MSKISDSILDKMCAKIEASESNKPNTCWVASAIACGEHTARIIVASSEPISRSAAIDAIARDLGNNVKAYAPSFTPLQSEAHPNMMFASVHAYKSATKIRPADETNMAKCQAITASTYLDVELGTVWERKEIDGKQYLLRANDDDLSEVMAIALTASVNTEARVDGNGFMLTPRVGDFVTFFAAEQLDDGTTRPFIDLAQVTEVTAGSIGISLEENGATANAYLPQASIVNIIEAAALDGNTSRQEIINFLKECYGPDYAKYLDSVK